MVTELVTNPERYLAERVKYPRIRWQIVIVVVAGVVANVWKPALIFQLGAAAGYVADVLIILAFVGVLEFVAVWLVLTGVMSVVSGVLGGDASYGRLLRVSGYGFVPLVASGLVWSVGHYVTLGDAGSPEPPLRAGFYHQYQSYVEFTARTAGDPVLYGAIAVGSVFVLASGYLWLRAIAAATDLDEREARVTAVVTVGLCLAWIFVSMV